MNKKCFSAFEKQVNRILENQSGFYNVNMDIFEQKVAEQKANSVSWGGREELEYLQDFNYSINKTVEDIFNETSNLLEKIGRKLSKKQSKVIVDKCISEICRYIDNYKKKFEEVMGHTNRTQSTNLELLKGNATGKITGYFELLQFVSYNKLDKAYRIAVISTIIAGTSALISLAAVILNFIMK